MSLEETDVVSAAILTKARELGRATTLLTHETGIFSISSTLKERIRSVSQKHALLASAVSDSGFINYEIESIFENFFIVETTIFEIIQSLKKKDIKKFPLVASRRGGKTIRLYALFESFLAETQNKVDKKTLLAFLAEYQKESPLSIRELNAVPIMLRLILVENFGTLIDSALQEVREFKDADNAYAFVKKSMSSSTEDPSRAIAALASRYPLVPVAFGSHLLERLSQDGALMRPVIKWIRLNLEKQGVSLDRMSEIEEHVHSNRTYIISNIVESLHWLNQVRWDSIAENINIVDSILTKDPSGIFSSLEMESKDLYRNVIVRIAEGVSVSEAEISRVALQLAGKAKGVYRHIGYYLLDPVGKNILEREVKYVQTQSEILYKKIITNPQKIYFGLVSLFTLAISLLFFVTVGSLFSGPVTFVVWCLVILMLSLEAGIIFVNILLTQFLPAKRLPRIRFDGDVGGGRRTCVVVPSMLRSTESIKNIVKKLEIRFLGNKERNIYYAFLFDYKDASKETLETDKVYAECLAAEVERLNSLYGEGSTRFFGLIRKRIWNENEGIFMGWERKRGKLREFNQLLRGSKNTSYIDDQNILSVGHIQYIITLDEDTEMPQDTARKLIGTIAHPLNAPILDNLGKVVRGYGIVQPRVAVRLGTAAKSLYSRLYAAGSGIDSYSGPISDVYQDLFGNALFFGKGIYDIDAVERSMSDKIPDNMVLSHDLLEGIYAHAGFASDVVLFDGFPDLYHEFIIRLERWIRGDWQIVSWLFSRRESFSAIDRFKIFDNLRRSIVPIAAASALFLSFVTNGHFLRVSLVIVFVLMLSHLLSAIISMLRLLAVPLRLHIPKIARDLRDVFVQTTLKMFFLLQQAWVSLSAVGITIFRLFVSRKNLLRWKNSHDVSNTPYGSFLKYYILFIASVSISIISLLYLWYQQLLFSEYSVWLVLWVIAPFVAVIISRPKQIKQTLSEKESLFVRTVAYRNSLYFLENANESTNWLVPDHVQECPVLAQESRVTTSPTNMGMHVTALVGAFDLGYISLPLFKERTEKLFSSLSHLYRYRGHFMNWYDIALLQPIAPQYVSSVDSANFLLALISAQQAYQEIPERLVVEPTSVKGLIDALTVFIENVSNFESTTEKPLRKNVKEIIASSRNLLSEIKEPEFDAPLREYHKIFSTFYDHLSVILHKIQTIATHDPRSVSNKLLISIERMLTVVRDHKNSLQNLIPHIVGPDLGSILYEEGHQVIVDTIRKIEKDLSTITTIRYIALDKPKQIRDHQFEQKIKQSQLSEDSKLKLLEWHKNVLEAVDFSAQSASEIMATFEKLQASCSLYIDETDFKFLYNKEKELFHIGYNVAFDKTDSACYNFMASEANSVSFMAILKGDVPQKHWFYLGRKLVRSGNLVSLISWGGSLFEYLTSLIFFEVHEESLLGSTANAAIKVHFNHAKTQNTLWGMGESAYCQFDLNKQYQYQIFGSPKLGLKRNLNDFLVVAPYTSALAMPFYPHKAVRNLKKFAKIGASGIYGFYDALDYMSGDKRLKKPVPTKVYYAHHQGFTLASLVNVLLENRMQKLFHSNLRVRALDVLFEEKMPEAPQVEELSAPVPLPSTHSTRTHDTGLESKRFIPLHTASPRYAFISNGDYSIRVGSGGASTSYFKGIALSRPNIDPENDTHGMFWYIKDKKTKGYYHLTPRLAEHHRRYKVIFYENKVEFLASHPSLDTVLSVSVDSQAPVEVRECTLHNTGQTTLSLDLTLYSEMSLAYPDRVFHHPHYEHLLVKAETLPRDNGIIFNRTHPANSTKNFYCAQLLVSKSLSRKKVHLSTSREDALTRFADFPSTSSLPSDHKKNATPLDPASNISTNIDILAGETASVVWVQIAAESREELEKLIRKYKHFNKVRSVVTHSIAESAISTRTHGMSQEQSVLFQEIASQALVGSMNPVEINSAVSISKEPLVHALWRMGISGDRPIAVFLIHDINDMQTVKQALKCHEYFKIKNIVLDIVILNNQPASYIKVLDDEIDFMIRQINSSGSKDTAGSLYQIKSDLISKSDRATLLRVARFVMDSHTDTLREALDKKYKNTRIVKTDKFIATSKYRTRLSSHTITALPNLSFYNSWGGFDASTKEYVMTISSLNMPPRTWSHIIAQPNFGTVVADSGSAYSWSLDSYDNRITAWTNDTQQYKSSEIVYLRDEETGEVWNPTPFPVETNQPFLVKYGFGYASYESVYSGIQQKFTTFVSLEDTVKISLLSLKNNSSKDKVISLYYYLEPSVGILRDHNRDYLSFAYDETSRALFFENEFRNQMPGRTAFASFGGTEGEVGWTTDKREFMGRFGSYESPSALRKEKLSNSILQGSENCVVISLKITIPAGTQIEIPILLGDAESQVDAKQKVASWSDNAKYAQSLVEIKNYWKQKLGSIEVKTGDSSIDFLMNGWLLYQTMSSRLYAKTGSSQPSGAYGFRDQLQDVCALVWPDPSFVRGFILKAASHQFKEGDALNWWHDHNNFGIRTVLSDHQLWLAYTLFEYVRTTGDKAIFDEEVAFIEAPILSFSDRKQWTGVPTLSTEKASVFEHAMRAIEKSLVFGSHGLPLMGLGDWNDGLSKVGSEGKGESVWTAWFLIRLINIVLPYLRERNEVEKLEKFTSALFTIEKAVKKFAWDGKWYRRAYFDNGTPLGSKSLKEFKIDSVAQSWSVISGGGDMKQAIVAHKSMAKMLLQEKYFALMYPALKDGYVKPGYIQDYPAGLRENGAQYNHAALWAVQSYLKIGDTETAEKIFSNINPILSAGTKENALKYRIEPYVVASDIYGGALAGRGGWSWYTGSAGVMYRTILEDILGIERRGDLLSIKPRLLKNMNNVKVLLPCGAARYNLTIKKPELSENILRVISATLDDRTCDPSAISFVNDGLEHEISIVLG